jgi:hypothetical protein
VGPLDISLRHSVMLKVEDGTLPGKADAKSLILDALGYARSLQICQRLVRRLRKGLAQNN